jgi:hypothetical protein
MCIHHDSRLGHAEFVKKRAILKKPTVHHGTTRAAGALPPDTGPAATNIALLNASGIL